MASEKERGLITRIPGLGRYIIHRRKMKSLTLEREKECGLSFIPDTSHGGVHHCRRLEGHDGPHRTETWDGRGIVEGNEVWENE